MKNKETKLIREAWLTLDRCFDPVSYSKHVDRLLEVSLEESKSHDRFRSQQIDRGISIVTEAKYFAIKRLHEYFTDKSQAPKVEDYMCFQKSCYIAYALAKSQETQEYVSKWYWTNKELIEAISSWDYCDLIKSEDRRRGFKSSPAMEV